AVSEGLDTGSQPVCIPFPTSLVSHEDFVAKSRPGEGLCRRDEYMQTSTAGPLSSPNSGQVFNKRQSDDPYACGEGNPCSNHACCGKTGVCGYGPDYCGTNGQSPNDNQSGFCGTTEEFCRVTDDDKTSCQSNCEQPGSGASGGDVQKHIIGYYEAWNYKNECIGMGIQDIPIGSLTHLYYSLGYIKPDSYDIIPMDDGNPPPYDIVSSESKRAKFIDKLKTFMTRYGFDGVDLDWEYPGEPDRGGKPDDGVNFTKLLREMRKAFDGMAGGHKEITFTAPTSYWYLRHFDIKASAEAADAVNVMAYDLHGIWDANNPIGPTVLAHSNLTEINLALNLFWRCLYKGGAAKGPCTDNSGTLSYAEIMDIIDANKLTPYHDKENAVKWITWGGDQWVSYDDFDTIQQKIEFANALGLGGLLIWAVDLDTPDLGALSAVVYPERLGARAEKATAADKWSKVDSGHCRVIDCGNPYCNPGEIMIDSQQCSAYDILNDSYKSSATCCLVEFAPDPRECTWRGLGDFGFCDGQCEAGEVALHGCGKNKKYRFCCAKDQKWKNCKWNGKPGSCFDNNCETGWQVSMTTSYRGEGEGCGFRHKDRERSFCCDPPPDKSPFLPVPLEYLFEHPPEDKEANTKFDLKVDPTYGGSSDVPFSEDPNNSPFGFVVMVSPDEIQVTLDRRDGSTASTP
ncbi:hypothetical protein PspLS_10880, partial [Pyricularia sp. CBS 133598]